MALGEWNALAQSFTYFRIAEGNVVFGIVSGDSPAGGVYRYDPRPTPSWTQVLSAAPLWCGGNDGALYVVAADGAGSGGMASRLVANAWEQLGTIRFASLALAREAVYGVESGTGNIFVFDEDAHSWTWIGQDPGLGISANDTAVYRRSRQFLPQRLYGGGWTNLGATGVGQLVVADNALYAFTSIYGAYGGLARYDSVADTWETIGNYFEDPCVYGTELYASNTLQDEGLWQFSATSGTWDLIGAGAETPAAGNTYIVGQVSSLPMAFEKPQQSDAPPASPAASPEEIGPAALPPPGWDWLFVFETISSYDGELWISPYNRDVILQSQRVPTTHFDAERLYAFPTTLGVTDVDSIDLFTTNNQFGDVLDLSYVFAWSRTGQQLYFFSLGGTVSDDPESPTYIAPVVGDISPSTTVSSIYVWKYSFPYAVGHAAMMLSTGDYISWWPNDEDPRSLSYRGKSFSAPARLPRTYSDDYFAEGHAPDYVIPVAGLNETAIYQWWQVYQKTNTWSLTGQNCAKTVFDALKAGGALNRLDSYYKAYFGSLILYTPNEIASLALMLPPIVEGRPASSHR